MSTNKSNTLVSQYRFNLPMGRIHFQSLFTPQLFPDSKPGDRPKFNCSVFFEIPAGVDNKVFFGEYQAAKEEMFKLPEVSKYGREWFDSLKSPVKKEIDPDKLEKYPYLQGLYMASASTYIPPVAFSPDLKTKYTKAEEPEVYRGSYGVMRVQLGIHNKEKFFFRLVGFQKIKDGEPVASAGCSIAEFVPYTATASVSLAEDDGI